ncbi:hypothetical protein [Streptomyces sp. NPDC002537]
MASTLDELRGKLDHVKAQFRASLGDKAMKSDFPGNIEDAVKQAFELRESLLSPPFYSVLGKRLARVLEAEYREKHGKDPAGEEKKRLEEQARNDTHRYIRGEAEEAFRRFTGGELRQYARKVLGSLELMGQEIPARVDLIQQVLGQIEKIKGYEFIQGLLSSKALVYAPNVRPLEDIAEQMMGHQEKALEIIKSFRSCLDGSPAQCSDAEIKRCIRKAQNLADRYFPAVERMSRNTEEAMNSLEFKVNDRMLEAYIRQEGVEASNVKAVEEAAGYGITLAEKLLESVPGVDIFASLGELISSVGAAAVRQAGIDSRKEKFLAEDVRTALFPKYNENPALLAADLQAKQLAALDILLNSVNLTISIGLPAAGGVAGGVSSAVKFAVETVLKDRIDRALAEIKDIQGPISLKDEPGMWDKVSGVFSETFGGPSENQGEKGLARELLSAVTTKLQEAKVAVSQKADAIIHHVVALIVKYANIPPAEMLTGVQLAAILDEVHLSRAPIGAVFADSVEREDPTPISGQADLPVSIKGKRVLRTNESRSKLTGDDTSYYVSVDFDGVEVWGRYNPKSRDWKAVDVDPAAFTSWSDVQIYSDAMETRTGAAKTKLTGTWLWVVIPEFGYTYIAFRPDCGGPLKWGHRFDTSGAKGRSYSLDSLIPEKLRIHKSIGDIYVL